MERVASYLTTSVLLVAVLVLLAEVAVVLSHPPERDQQATDFYVLGNGGQAANYPTELARNESGTVLVGVRNHRDRPAEYTILTTLDEQTIERRTVTVPANEARHENVTFTVRDPGRHRLRFELYEGNASVRATPPLRTLRLWLSVEPRGSTTSTASSMSREPMQASDTTGRTASGQ